MIMTATAQKMGSPDRAMGSRIRDYLRYKAYPVPGAAKRAARDFKVSASTAKRWLAGEAPTTDHLSKMAEVWGRPFVEAVFLPDAPDAVDQLRCDIRELNDRLDRVLKAFPQ